MKFDPADKLDTLRKKSDSFSEFFLRASEEEIKKVLTEAAHKANEDQLRLFKKSRLVEII